MGHRYRNPIRWFVRAALVLSLALGHAVLAPMSLAAPSVGMPGNVQGAPNGHHPRHERIPALMYHRIKCAPEWTRGPHRWVCPERFDATLKLLKDRGWDTLTARQVSRRLKLGLPFPDRTFVIIIDDGRRDGYDNGFPILEKYGFEAVYAVVVERVDVLSSAMTWDELRELEANGHEIANHSMSHANLGSEDARLWREIELSSQVLADNLGHRPKTFVYPYGSWSYAAVERLRKSGFRIAYTTDRGCVLSWKDRLLEERIRINRSDTPQEVLDKMEPCA